MANTNNKPGFRPAKACPRPRPGNKISQERQIKVTRSHYEYKPNDSNGYHCTRYVPWIQMKGKWLEQAGFSIDTPVKIRVMDGCLVLTTEEQR